MCYKPIPSRSISHNVKHSCTIVCKTKEEYNSINGLIEEVKKEGKKFVFHRDDILLLLGEKHDSNLGSRKKLLTCLQEKYNMHKWNKIDDEHFSAPLEFDEFMDLALQAYTNNHRFLTKQEILSTVRIKINNEDTIEYYSRTIFKKNLTKINLL